MLPVRQNLAILLAERALGVLLVERNLVRTAAQRAYVMDKGRVIATIGREELQDTERVADYLAI